MATATTVTTLTPKFDITPEKRASQRHYHYRQLFVTPKPVPQNVDLTGKVAIVTGANGGLGFETAKSLLSLGASVILAVRDESRGEAAAKKLQSSLKSGSTIKVWKLDLSSYHSIRAFAARCDKELERLDMAVLNAGIFKITEAFAEGTGYEEGVQINYLSNVLLSILLLPIIKAKKTPGGGPGRLCLVSSDTSAWSSLKLDAKGVSIVGGNAPSPLLPAFKEKMQPSFDPFDRYGGTKLLGQLFLTELAKRVPAEDVIVDCANPGFCTGSDLGRETSGIFRAVYKAQCALLARTCEVGARTLVHAVTTVDGKGHGQYIEDAKVQP